jgi:hypothetical protein
MTIQGGSEGQQKRVKTEIAPLFDEMGLELIEARLNDVGSRSSEHFFVQSKNTGKRYHFCASGGVDGGWLDIKYIHGKL